MLSRIVKLRASLMTPANIRHYGGFVLAAVLAFIVDAGILEALTSHVGMSPFIARPIGIFFAMIVSWLVNRIVSFAMTTPARISEFVRFVAVSGTAQAINYAFFSVILLAVPGTPPLTALVLACFVSMFVSYTGYRLSVFRKGS